MKNKKEEEEEMNKKKKQHKCKICFGFQLFEIFILIKIQQKEKRGKNKKKRGKKVNSKKLR